METFKKLFGILTPSIALFALLVGLLALRMSREMRDVRVDSGAGQWKGRARGKGASLDVAFEKKVKAVSAQVAPAVVSIELKPREEMVWKGMNLGKEENAIYPMDSQLCYGSGVLFREGGYVLTSCHLLCLGDMVEVRFPGGEKSDANILGMDPLTDIGVVRIAGAPEIKPAPMGSSEDLEVGQWVLAFGSPVHYGQTVTCGIVSAVGRQGIPVPSQMSSYADLIQTDAAINGGSSGGPLVNLRGEVVGLNSAIVTREGNYQGIGFAIPIDRALRVAEELIKRGRVIRPWLGITQQQVDRSLARALGMKDVMGALVTRMYPGFQAEKAGMQRGDVIVEYEGIPVEDGRHLQQLVGMSSVGETAAVSAIRRGRLMQFSVLLEERPERLSTKVRTKSRAVAHDRFGMHIADLTTFAAERLNLVEDEGVLVSSVLPGSPADRAGIRSGDALLELDAATLRGERDYLRGLSSLRGKGPYVFLVANEQDLRYLAMSPEGKR